MIRFLSIVFLALVFVFSPAEASQKEKPIHFVVISCSLNPKSHSAILAQQAVKDLKAQGQDVDLIDLRDYNLPMTDGNDGKAYENPQVKELNQRIEKADGILIASPIYLNSVAASTKNMAELTTHKHKDIISGKAWKNKVVGFMGASGGKFSLYAFFPFINSMMIDSKIVFVPGFVMTTREDFDANEQLSKAAGERVGDLTKDLVHMTSALKVGRTEANSIAP